MAMAEPNQNQAKPGWRSAAKERCGAVKLMLRQLEVLISTFAPRRPLAREDLV
jgi:hypothetical protein